MKISDQCSFLSVILSGGSGTRLWPVSRSQFPKQFCEIFEASLQELTLKRVSHWGQPLILTSQSLQSLTMSQANKMGLEKYDALYEPAAKNTAPAVAFLLRYLEIQNRTQEIVGVFPADQLIQDESNFKKAVETARQAAQAGQIVTLGIQPTEPNTGFGYIQAQQKNLLSVSPVEKFHEKPNRETAERFLAQGNFFWNAGIFIFKAADLIAHFSRLQPEIWKLAKQIKPDLSNLSEIYARFPSISLDYAIMEKLSAKELSCVPVEMGWSDVGSWDSVAQLLANKKDLSKIVAVESENSFVFSKKKDKVYSLIGAKDLIVVDTDDALLVLKKGESQKVKHVVDQLIAHKEPQTSKLAVQHTFEERPWGKFEILRDENSFKSKVIEVHPGQQLSLQSHAKREEHWVVTAGSGEVVLGDQVLPVKYGTYIHIPLGAKHRMRNTGLKTLQFVEIQMGTYFGEDDIVRYHDDYKRS